MKKIALMLLCTLILSSCEKEKQLIVENTNIPLLSEVRIGDETYMEYSYNDANLVIEEKSKFHYTKHTYNYLNQLVNSDFYWDISMASSDSHVLEAAMNREEWVNPDNTAKSLTQGLEYNNNGELIRKSYIRPSVSNSEYNEFMYENGRIVRITGYYKNSISGYTNYIYDDSGNITKQTKYIVSPAGIAELTTTTEYEYDNMHNPFLAFKRLMTPGKYTNPNNITKETYTINFDVDPSIEKVQIRVNTYEYNERGYPVKVNGTTEYVYQ